MRGRKKTFFLIRKKVIDFTGNKCDTICPMIKNPPVCIVLTTNGDLIATNEIKEGEVLKRTTTEYPVIRVPEKFLYDHMIGRECPSPFIVRETKQHYFIAAIDCDGWRDLVSDAEFYTDPYGPDAEGLEGLKKSAKATLKVLREVTPVTLERTYKIEMLSDTCPSLGWFNVLDSSDSIDIDAPPLRTRLFTSRKEAEEFIDRNQLEGHGCDLRIVPC